MALIAVNAVVHISSYTRMASIRVCLCMLMTVGAGEHRVVRRICVTGRADAVGIPVVGWEICMIECRPAPRRRGMTCFTCRRKAGRSVVWIRSVAVIGRMTHVAAAVHELVAAVRAARLT